jgi:hypothetical protein
MRSEPTAPEPLKSMLVSGMVAMKDTLNIHIGQMLTGTMYKYN